MPSVPIDEIRVFAGSGSRRLGASICEALGVPPGQCDVIRFSEGNLFVRVLESVRGRRVYVVQTVAFPANDNFVELLFWIDALKRASAESVTAIIPYFSYAKGDKIDEPRVSIRARVCADAIQAAGVDRVVTLDLHSPQIQGFFKVPVDDLNALPTLCDGLAAELNAIPRDELVVVSPDVGFAKKARRFAERLHASLAIGDKAHPSHDERAEVLELIGDVAGKTAIIVDDLRFMRHPDRFSAPAARTRRKAYHRLRYAWGIRAGDDGETRCQPHRAALHYGQRRNPAGHLVEACACRFGCAPAGGSGPPYPPARKSERAFFCSLAAIQ